MCITLHDEFNCGLCVWQNPRTTSLKFSVSYIKDTTKDSQGQTIDKTAPKQTKPNLTMRNPLFEMANSSSYMQGFK